MHRKSSRFLRRFERLRRWFNGAEDKLIALWTKLTTPRVDPVSVGRHRNDPSHEVQYSHDVLDSTATLVRMPRSRSISTVIQRVKHTVIAATAKEPARPKPAVGRVSVHQVDLIAVVGIALHEVAREQLALAGPRHQLGG